jgi:hypothetical protein
MDRPLTSDELRIAARQAITIAITMKDETVRQDLLLRAQKLLEEAQALRSYLVSQAGSI